MLTVATAGLLLLQVPLADVSVNVVEVPAHIVVAPFIPPTIVLPFTIIVAVLLIGPQLAVMVYDIIAAPALIPFTTPVALLTEATAVLLLLHTPPAVASLRVVDVPVHIVVVPAIAAMVGAVPTVITLVAVAVPQLEGTE